MIPKSPHEMEFTARMNVIYHERRAAMLGGLINWTAFSSLIVASAAFAGLHHHPVVASAATLLVAGLNGAVLAFGVDGRRLRHLDLLREWLAILARAHAISRDNLPLDDQALTEFYRVSALEPPPNDRALKAAYRLTCDAMGLEPARR
jgi:hypothetical protein